MPLSSCPVCGGRTLLPGASAADLQQEVRERNEFIYSRLKRRATRAELKDLTDFMHDGDATVLVCGRCGLLIRDEEETRATASYEEDPNDPDLMQHVYPRYVEAFRRKRQAYADRLPAGASVLELGSHLGGFLQAAEEWNWRPVGLDIGRDTSEFAVQKGLTVRRETIEDTGLAGSSADAVFIWNCFEQLAEPEKTLISARRLLKRDGLLLLRVPNARSWMELRGRPDGFARSTLAWNNLLGFPYLYGYDMHSLNRLVCSYGFEPVRGFNSEILTLPFPDLSGSLAQEQRDASTAAQEYAERTTEATHTLTGPWIEILYRKRDGIGRLSPLLDPRFLSRAA